MYTKDKIDIGSVQQIFSTEDDRLSTAGACKLYIKNDHFDKEFGDAKGYINMLVKEKKSVVRQTLIYCLDKGIMIDMENFELISKEALEKLNENDKQVYNGLLKAMVFLMKVDEKEDVPEAI